MGREGVDQQQTWRLSFVGGEGREGRGGEGGQSEANLEVVICRWGGR